MEFTDWFKRWLRKHPLREPPSFDRVRYTADVMDRIKDLASSYAEQYENRSFVVSWPRFVFGGLSVALMAVLVVLATASYTSRRLAKEVTREAQVLAGLGEPVASSESDTEEIALDIQAADNLVLAEATKSDDQWLQETFQLLDQLGEDPKTGNTNESSDEDWLDELQMLDDNELSSSS